MKREIMEKLKILRVLACTLILVGAVLVIYMIRVEDEPGALPLFLILAGTVWFFMNRYQIKQQLKKGKIFSSDKTSKS